MSSSSPHIARWILIIIEFVLTLVSIVVFLSPLVLGLIVYFNFNDIGITCANFFVTKVGYDVTGVYSLETYYISLSQIIGASLLTFTPLSAYALVFAIAMIFDIFGISPNDEDTIPFIALILAALTAIAISIVYWWMITRPLSVNSTIMSTAGSPMHWGYRWLFYLFPLIAIAIEAIAIFVGAFIMEKLELEEIQFLYPAVTLFGAAIGIGLIALLYFTFVKIIIFIASIAGSLLLIGLFFSALSPSKRYYTDGKGVGRAYHEDFLGDAYIDKDDIDSWKGYDGD